MKNLLKMLAIVLAMLLVFPSRAAEFGTADEAVAMVHKAV